MAPSRFTGVCGSVFSVAQAFVPGYGPSTLRYGKSFSASTTPASALTRLHVYVFDNTSVTVYRAMSRALKYLSTFRTSQ